MNPNSARRIKRFSVQPHSQRTLVQYRDGWRNVNMMETLFKSIYVSKRKSNLL